MVYEESNSKFGGKSEHEVLAMVYVPRQKWQEIYKYDTGLMRGTIFAELDKPWFGKEGRRGSVKFSK
ncbi:MAG: spore coat associated protein CotJA [Oscillospiraceae bacterium]|nr:spore coat associated protein CotJA [Oscillospiraceae bacterium]